MTARLLTILLSLSSVGMPLPYGEWPSARDVSRLHSGCVEGENSVHPQGGAYYLACANGALRQRRCGVGRLFSAHAGKCVNARAMHRESGAIQRLPLRDTAHLQHERRYLRSTASSGRGAQSSYKTRTKLPVNSKNGIHLKNTEEREKAVPNGNAFNGDLRYERFQGIRSRRQKMRISADRRRSDTERRMACVGCFRKLSAAEKVKSVMVTRSPERSPISTRFSMYTTGDNSPSSSSYISSPQYNRRIQASRSLSHTRSATPLKENRSSAVSPTVEPLRALPTSVTSRKALPSTSAPVNFKSTRKKCFRKAKLLSSINVAHTRTRSSSLPSERKREAPKQSVSASEPSTANLSNDAADVNALQKNITVMNKFLTTTASYKQNTHDNAEGVRSVAATMLETSAGPELKETTALDRPPSIGTVHMSFVERTPVVTEALLNGQNLAPPLTSGSNARTSGVGIVITESSVLRTQEDGRINSSKDLLGKVIVPEILRNATVKVQRHQDDGRMKPGTTPVAYTEVSPLQSSEDVTNTTGEETEKPREIKNRSSDSTSSQNEASMTGSTHHLIVMVASTWSMFHYRCIPLPDDVQVMLIWMTSAQPICYKCLELTNANKALKRKCTSVRNLHCLFKYLEKLHLRQCHTIPQV
ncbi:uncharacterized protein LOC142573217 isoform X1 [Dermacentor variabilis]|uniref:uncharacterized protein LOC142573217 isoform X1 n=1 Tax=Dermacentor variabilis TaxID=34621 RepID=UPI003F5C860D